MAKGNRDRCGELVCALAAQWRVEVTDPLLEGYWLGLSDISPEKLERVVTRAIRECDFMPPASKLRELAGVGKGIKPYHLPAPKPERVCDAHRLGAVALSRDPGCVACQRDMLTGLAEAKALPEPDRRLPREREDD